MIARHRRIVVCLITIALIALAGCTGADTSVTADTRSDGVNGEISRFAFAEDNTICHIYSWGEAGGIDCYVANTSVNGDVYADSSSFSGTIVPDGTNSVEFGQGQVERVAYPDERRVCYAYSWGRAAGIECVPMSER